MPTSLTNDACPKCGSTRLHWRNRRFYDLVLTWLATSLSSSMAWGDCDSPWLYDLPLEYYAQPPSLETPKRFWKCLDCLERGEQFEPPAGIEETGVATKAGRARKSQGLVRPAAG